MDHDHEGQIPTHCEATEDNSLGTAHVSITQWQCRFFILMELVLVDAAIPVHCLYPSHLWPGIDMTMTGRLFSPQA